MKIKNMFNLEIIIDALLMASIVNVYRIEDVLGGQNEH